MAFIALVWVLAEVVGGDDAAPVGVAVEPLVVAPADVAGSAHEPGADAAQLAGRPGAARVLDAESEAGASGLLSLVGRPLVVSGRTVDVLGRPLAGARVVFVPSGETRVASGLSAFGNLPPLEQLPAVVSGADGRFEIAGSVVQRGEGPAPQYSGHARSTRLAVDAPGCVRATPELVTRDLHLGLTLGEPLRVEAGDVRLLPEARLQGRAVDAQGAALAGLAVSLMTYARGAQEAAPDNDLLPDLATTTGADGRFVLGGLWGQERRVRVGVEGHHVEIVWARTTVGETTDLGDVVLRFSGGLAGQVLDTRGEPVAGATVLVRHTNPESLEYGSSFRDRIAYKLATDGGLRLTTDVEGRFLAEQLHGPLQYVVAAAPWHAPVLVSGLMTGSDDVAVVLPDAARALIHVVDAATGRTLSGADVRAFFATGLINTTHVPALVVGGAALQDLLERRPLVMSASPTKPSAIAPPETAGRFLAELGRHLGGRFEASLPGYATGRVDVPGAAPGQLVPVTLALQPGARVEGCVTTSAGEPVAGAQVDCALTDRKATDGPWRTLSDAEGRYRVDDLPAGELRVALAPYVGPGRTTGPPRVLSLSAGERRRDVDLAVVVGGSVEGRAVEADGAPRAGLRVVLRSDQDLFAARQVLADDAGEFRFDDVPPGAWLASDGDRERGDLPLQVVAGESASVELRRSAGAWLTGVVTDRLTGQPLPGVRVAQAADDSVFQAGRHTADFVMLTDAAGRFAARRQTLGWYGPGDLWLYTQVAGSQVVAQQPLDEALDADVEVDVAIGGSTLSLVVSDEVSGAPVPGLRVRLGRAFLEVIERGLGVQYLDVSTDDDGRLTLEHLEPGRCAVRLDGPGHAPQWSMVLLAEGHNDVALQARPSATLEGLLLHEDGSPAWEGSRLEFRWQGVEVDCEERLHAATISGGRFRVEGLTPGRWRVSAVGEPLDTRLVLRGHDGRDVELAPGETLSLECVVLDDL